jgi:hypothetical protein
VPLCYYDPLRGVLLDYLRQSSVWIQDMNHVASVDGQMMLHLTLVVASGPPDEQLVRALSGETELQVLRAMLGTAITQTEDEWIVVKDTDLKKDFEIEQTRMENEFATLVTVREKK